MSDDDMEGGFGEKRVAADEASREREKKREEALMLSRSMAVLSAPTQLLLSHTSFSTLSLSEPKQNKHRLWLRVFGRGGRR